MSTLFTLPMLLDAKYWHLKLGLEAVEEVSLKIGRVGNAGDGALVNAYKTFTTILFKPCQLKKSVRKATVQLKESKTNVKVIHNPHD